MPVEGKASFKLFEVAKNTFSVPGGFYRGSFALIMNQERFDDLSDADRAALADVFGENLSRMAGKAWDQIDAVGQAKLEATADNAFTAATAEDAAKWQGMTAPIIAGVLAEVTAKGIDAAAAQAFIAAEMAKN